MRAAPTPPAAPANPAPTADEWAKQHAKVLGDANLKKGLKVFWFAIGKDDFLLAQNNATVEFFQKQGFTPVVKETDGRPHVDQLARLPDRVRADAVPVRESTEGTEGTGFTTEARR